MSAYAPEQQQSETEVVSGQVTAIITKPGEKWQVSVNTGGQFARNLWTKDAGLVNQMQAAIGQSFDFICGASHWQGQNGPVRSLWINSVALYGSTPQQAQPLPQQAPPPVLPQQPVQQSIPVPTQPDMRGTTEWNPAYAQQSVPTVPQVQQAIASGQLPQGQPVTQNPPFPTGMPTLSPMEKEERIMREHAMGVVASMLPYMPMEDRNAPGMVKVAEGLIRYYREGPSGLQRNGQPPEPQSIAADSGYIPVAARSDEGPTPQQLPLQPDPDDGIPF